MCDMATGQPDLGRRAAALTRLCRAADCLLARLLHRRAVAAATLIDALMQVGLLARTGRAVEPPDVPAERMGRHRQRHRDVTPAVTVTNSENQRVREQSSEEPDGSSAPAALAGPAGWICDEGIAVPARTGPPGSRDGSSGEGGALARRRATQDGSSVVQVAGDGASVAERAHRRVDPAADLHRLGAARAEAAAGRRRAAARAARRRRGWRPA